MSDSFEEFHEADTTDVNVSKNEEEVPPQINQHGVSRDATQVLVEKQIRDYLDRIAMESATDE